MQRVRISLLAFVAIFTLSLITACGGGDDGGGDQPSDTILGTVLAPNAIVARAFSDKPFYLALLDFVIPQTTAAVTGLAPVAGAFVELIRIDNSGAQVGGTLAQAVTDSSGQYIMETGTNGIPPSGDLVLQVTGSGGATMRAIYTLGGADVNPITDFIVDTIVAQPGVELESLNILFVEELQLRATFGDFEIDFSSATTLSDAEILIQASPDVGGSIQQQVDDLIGATSVGLPIDMTGLTAASTISYQGGCALGGWDYSFTADTMTITGTDTFNIDFNTGNCTVGPEETIDLSMPYNADPDIPFNCAAYPVCTVDDFNKKMTGVDGDGRSFTSFYSYNGNINTLTYTKYLPEEYFTEEIVITVPATN